MSVCFVCVCSNVQLAAGEVRLRSLPCMPVDHRLHTPKKHPPPDPLFFAALTGKKGGLSHEAKVVSSDAAVGCDVLHAGPGTAVTVYCSHQCEDSPRTVQ